MPPPSPLAEPDPAVTTNLLDLVSGAAEAYGDRPYLLPAEEGGPAVTFADVLTFTRGCAALLDEYDVPPGARVATVMHNSPLAALLFLGVIAAQRTLVPLNPKSGAGELDALLAHSGPVFGFGPASAAAQLRADLPWRSVDDEAAVLADILARGAAYRGELAGRGADGGGDAEIVYTSGSTGTPKGVVLSHRALLANSLAMVHWADAGPDDVLLNVVPLFHAGGQGFPTLTPLWSGGRTACVRSELAMVRFWHYVDRYHPTWTLVVNAYLANLVERPERPAASRLKGVLAGGSALSPELIHRFESTFDIPVYQVYGMTEMTSLTTVEPRDRKPGEPRTAGAPVSFAQVRVVDPAGRDVPAGENGEVLLSGPSIFTRYENAPELTRQRCSDGWVRSGDLGHLDENGELSIVDRIDSMVIVSGENVYPAEIENVVPQLEGVEDAVVAALPHPVTGVELVLVYRLLPGAVARDDEWRGALRRNLSTFKVPRRFVAVEEIGVDSFPRTPLGKIQRPEVQRLAIAHLT
ncbi:class I adenylate-forming enzyme family protein [Plantactinospora sp. KLBMP9567]|uniref:class I adenylate-forming enzyme family protein n=1 Tax=Plantactinospora sp. KLBMP9567 TaxID=3085900 RepID=UPI002980DAEE|nr:class I adenylate-forming enzyme family protein [Plantactinospora sp. KLBMP9567]MDW5325673.1 class I adenylate-forming enzyme family protein [Plantactinospora sp. KLBMP9567]